MSNERLDSAMAEKILRGDDTDPDILQSLGLELLAELKRMYERETELLTALQVIKEYTNESQSMDNIKDYVNNACDTNLPYWGCACQGPHTGPC